jgi:hypothetical protein
VTSVRTDVSEERITSIIRVRRIGVLGTALALSIEARCEEIRTMYYILLCTICYIVFLRSVLRLLVKRSYLAYCCHPDDGHDTFLRNFGSYKSHGGVKSQKT